MLSVVIPTRNAGPRFGAVLAALVPGAMEGLVKEVVIADGGSQDRTLELAEEAGCRIVACEPGRGGQLRAGCAAARADWLLALHADTLPGHGWVEAVGDHVSVHPDKAGYFRHRFDDPSAAARVWEAGIALRCRLFAAPYGDQGLLVSRRLYDEAGGFPDWPLLEDLALVRRLGRRRLRPLDAAVLTAADRYRRDGWVGRTLRNQAILLRWALGAAPEDLARRYG